MFLSILAIIGGLVSLVFSADFFISGSSNVAKRFGMPPLLIGIIIIGFGTSTPEMLVALISAIDGVPEVAVGTAYGSNITNIALGLGLTAMVSPVMVNSSVLKKELPILLVVTFISFIMLRDLVFSRTDAMIIVALFGLYVIWIIYQSKVSIGDSLDSEVKQEIEQSKILPLGRASIYMIGGLIALLVSSKVLVWGATNVAKSMGVSDLIIGLTIVAIGTSLPEIFTSIIAARKDETDLAVGNIVGSNIFNSLAAIGFPGLIRSIPIQSEVLTRDMSTMMALTVALFIFGIGTKSRQGRINRFEGGVFVIAYSIYSYGLFLSARG